MAEAEATKSCIVCEAKIADSASYCSVCGHYQKPWKNFFRFIGPLVAVVSAVAAAAVFIIDRRDSIGRFFNFQDDVRVVYFGQYTSSGFGNFGDGDVYLRDLKIFSPPGVARTILLIDMTVSRNSIGVRESTTDNWHFIRDIPAGKWLEYTGASDCYELMYYSDNHPMIANVSDRAKFSGEGELTYVSLRDGTEAKIEFPLFGSLILWKHPHCSEYLLRHPS